MKTTLAFVILAAAGLAHAEVASKSKCHHGHGQRGVKNVVLMISDGFGPASETTARTFFQVRDNLKYTYKSPLDDIIVGNVRTKAYDNWVTDSASAATAYACGVKTFNAAIGVTHDNKNCGTVVEAAKLKGLSTGLVTTTRVTHATPAGFAAHVPERDWEALIAQQLIGDNPIGGRTLDVLIGGGSSFFFPNTTKGSKRTDDRDLYKEATTKFGWKNVALTRSQFDSIPNDKSALPLLATFTPSHMSYQIDRNATLEPSLAEMSHKALQALKDEGKGFFLMIEGGRIDHAGHINDPAAHIHDIKAYWDTVELVKKFADEDGHTLVIHVSDHETGGLTAARQMTSTQKDGSNTTAAFPYEWFPQHLLKASASTEKLASLIRAQAAVPGADLFTFVKNLVIKSYGIDVRDEEVTHLIAALRREAGGAQFTEWALGEMLNSRAELGWTTHGHTGVDVILGTYGATSNSIRGSYENTEISDIIEQRLRIDRSKVKFAYPPPPMPALTRRSDSESHVFGLHD
ncbi:alkaline phosphatase [Fimicolochytrium jonesii]|uniref:alkaline phosphatase n=1 Tax=Fimicolochytrium jonesii TaxID=1396493 RepID=UPI0022FE8981|nr:alkaline phosphatase [Fimicolochytrium jonesii]KAI8820733.1 alkaline phosphatase [Fimicolochytrium jonesii]